MMEEQSLKPRGVVINYHYVNDNNDSFYKLLKKTGLGQFKNQLAELLKNFNVVSPKDFEHIVCGAKNPEGRFFTLTFDDGLKDHYKYIFPVLKAYGIKAGFAVPTAIFERKEVISAHKNHILLASLAEHLLIEKFNKNLSDDFPDFYEKYKIDDVPKQNPEDPYLLALKYRRDNVLIGNLKYTLLLMDKNIKEFILNTIFKELYPDEEKVFDEFYLNGRELAEMADAGMEIIGHGHTHNNLSSMSAEDQEREITVSKDIIKKLFGREMSQFSYPYGGYNRTTMELLRKHGFRCALTVKGNDIDFKGDPFEINRYSTVDFFR